MSRIILPTLFLCAVTSVAQKNTSCPFGECAKDSAQVTYIYKKGKTFDNVSAHSMPSAISLTEPQQLLYKELTMPKEQHTIAYTVSLPEYVKGMFFTRDNRPGDYQWPNNTNRLLPWAFAKLEDLSKETYKGIPSNGKPSLIGDALLLELSDGQYMYVKTLAGDNTMSWLKINTDGSLTVHLSTLGTDMLCAGAPVLLMQKGATPYTAISMAYATLIHENGISSTRKRTDKGYFEAFRYLGWCSWEHYHYDIDEEKMLRDIDAIEQSGIPIRYVLIDDGHVTNRGKQLTSFIPDTSRFPNGWTKIMSRKSDDKIKWVGLWYNFCGYWNGISGDNDFPAHIKNTLYPYNGTMLPGRQEENIHTFYHYYIKTLKDYGFDFLKIDNQAFLLPLYMGGTDVVRQAKACNMSLEQEAHQQQMGLMNCMAQNIVNIDNTLYSNVTRVSIDYKKYNEDMAKSHLFQSYANTLLQGQTVWPDHDMFHSSDTICGALMARSKAMSGGPVYLSDSPSDFIEENITPLIDHEGKLFRPEAPAVPTPESVITNALEDGSAYRVFAPTGNEALSLVGYNLNTSPLHDQVKLTIRKDDYLLRETMTGHTAVKPRRVLLYDWEEQMVTELRDSQSVMLKGFSDKLFHLCPIIDGWAVIGIKQKYLAPATVRIVSRNKKMLVLEALCGGTLLVAVDHGGKPSLRSIEINTPGRVTIRK